MGDVNQQIIHFLEEQNQESIKLDFIDFLKFAKFIGQTEDGSFQVLLNSKNINLRISLYGSYFWNIYSDNENLLKNIMESTIISSFNPELANDSN